MFFWGKSGSVDTPPPLSGKFQFIFLTLPLICLRLDLLCTEREQQEIELQTI